MLPEPEVSFILISYAVQLHISVTILPGFRRSLVVNSGIVFCRQMSTLGTSAVNHDTVQKDEGLIVFFLGTDISKMHFTVIYLFIYFFLRVHQLFNLRPMMIFKSGSLFFVANPTYELARKSKSIINPIFNFIKDLKGWYISGF